jgi:hypothetical protein
MFDLKILRNYSEINSFIKNIKELKNKQKSLNNHIK